MRAGAGPGRGCPLAEAAVVVVGGGPAGLTAAASLAGRVDGPVLVVEREAEAGGVPRHSDHLGYGLRDLRRFVSGPAYARRLAERARDAGALVETSAMVTGWAGERALAITAPTGRRVVRAGAVVLATGARERPRPARLIPGERPDGVYTTGELQQLVHLRRARVGGRAVVVGGELVSWSAVLTLRESGCTPVAMVTAQPRSEAYAAFRLAGRAVLRGPVLTGSRVVSIEGKDRVSAVVVEERGSGRRRRIDCDTVVLTGDWIPDHELARLGGIALDPSTRGPVIDAALRTSVDGVFAAGNLLHPVDTADGAALDGRHVAAAVRSWLAAPTPAALGARLAPGTSVRWLAPQLVVPGERPPRGHLLLWVNNYQRRPRVVARQAGRVIGQARTVWPAAPGRVYRAPWSVVAAADPGAGEVTVEVS